MASTQRITLNTPKRWRAPRLKAVALLLLSSMLAVTIIGIPFAAMLWTYTAFRYGSHKLWLETQNDR